MKITTKHYYCFGNKDRQVGKNLISAMSWDAVRIDDDQDNPFSMPRDRLEWLKKCQNNVIVQRADAISDFLKSQNTYERINSFGVGCAFMEQNLKLKNPEIFLYCCDFTPKTIERLKNVFKEADAIEMFDILHGNWVNTGNKTLYILHRIDNDFSNDQWLSIFKNMNLAGIGDILFIPCEVSSIKDLIRRKISFFYQILKGNNMSFAGYLRTKDQLTFLFHKYYNLIEEIKVGDLTGFFLKRKNLM